MNISDILELTKAGWSKDEILLLAKNMAVANDAEKIEHPEPKEEPKQEPKEEPKEEPKQESETDKLLKALGLKLDAMTTAMQNSNVNYLEQEKANVLTADDVVAQLINPNYNKGDEK